MYNQILDANILDQTRDRGDPLVVKVTSDPICPWCFLAKRRLDRAIERVHARVEVAWRPFQLFPEIPPGGVSTTEFLNNRFGDPTAIAQVFDRLAQLGGAVGIDFSFERIKRLPNTLDAHRLIRLAGGSGRQSRFVDALFKAYFEEGLDIGNRAVLLALAELIGMDHDQVLAVLNDDRLLKIEVAESTEARQVDGNALPSMLINDRWLINGIQEGDTLVQAFDFALFGAPGDSPLTRTVH